MKKKTGDWAENFVANYLQNSGYEIWERNWRFRRAEIDIIAFKKAKIYIVEVKYRRFQGFSLNSNLISIKKRRLLVAAANAYLIQNRLDFEVQFDTIFVINRNGILELIHSPFAFNQLDTE